MYIRILETLGLATVRKVAPKLEVEPPAKPAPDLATLQAVITHRYAVATAYARTLKAACAAELARLRERAGRSEFADVPSMRGLKRWLSGDTVSALRERERATLAEAMAKSKALSTIYAMRQELNALWERSTESSEQLLARLQDWCQRAEASRHRAARAVLAAAQALRVAPAARTRSRTQQKKPADRRAFLHCRRATRRRYLSFVSLYIDVLAGDGIELLDLHLLRHQSSCSWSSCRSGRCRPTIRA